MRFADVLGQDRAVGLLRRVIRTGRVHHAYLFVGPSGTGRHDAARAFAQALQCERPSPDPCNTCPPCMKAERGVHPDIRWVSPLEGRQSIGIEQVREMRAEAAYGPYEGQYRVYILTPAERLLPEAQNALLKLFEEPPPRTVLVLVGESPTALLPTVLSRVQVVRFGFVASSEIERALRERFGLDPRRARLLAALSGGRPALAVRWAQTPDALKDRDRVVERLVRVEREGPVAAHEFADELAAERDRAAESLDVALLWYRDLVVYRETADEHLVVNVDRLDEIRRLAPLLDPKALRARIGAIERAKADLRRNVHPRLALDAMFLEFTPAGAVRERSTQKAGEEGEEQ